MKYSTLEAIPNVYILSPIIFNKACSLLNIIFPYACTEYKNTKILNWNISNYVSTVQISMWNFFLAYISSQSFRNLTT